MFVEDVLELIEYQYQCWADSLDVAGQPHSHFEGRWEDLRKLRSYPLEERVAAAKVRRADQVYGSRGIRGGAGNLGSPGVNAGGLRARNGRDAASAATGAETSGGVMSERGWLPSVLVLGPLPEDDQLERAVDITPAWDRRDEGLGQGTCNLWFILRGREGAVCFRVSSGWRAVVADVVEDTCLEHYPANATGLFYHSRVPMRPRQEVSDGTCEFLSGAPCYSDGTYSGADEPWRVLREKGSAGLWGYLERYYRQVFLGSEEDGSAPMTFGETLSLACELMTGRPLGAEDDDE